MTSILSWRTGFPFTVGSGVDNARTGQSGQRAEVIGNPDLGDRSRGQTVEEYLNRNAFEQNVLGTYGAQGRNSFRGPGFFSMDIGLHKNFPITERFGMEFRFEAFNLFNNVNLNNPNTTFTNANFMRITSADDPRILQFALRASF
jgi:hypothetical protein